MWMWIAVKYGTWNVAQPASGAVHVLLQAGYSPLTAMVLAGRGLEQPRESKEIFRFVTALCQTRF